MTRLSRQFMLFLLTGGVAAAVNFFSRMLYQLVMSFASAVVVAYLTGMVTAFILAKKFVFQHAASDTRTSFFYFALVNLLAVLQTWGISLLMAYHVLPWCGIDAFRYEIAHAIGLVIPVLTSFIGHKYLSFR